MTAWWPWDVLIILGAYHGLNPGMGWLFAVARGLQERSRAAVWQSFLPIAIGHEAAIAVVVILVAVAQFLIAPEALRITGAVVLFAVAGTGGGDAAHRGAPYRHGSGGNRRLRALWGRVPPSGLVQCRPALDGDVARGRSDYAVQLAPRLTRA